MNAQVDDDDDDDDDDYDNDDHKGTSISGMISFKFISTARNSDKTFQKWLAKSYWFQINIRTLNDFEIYIKNSIQVQACTETTFMTYL